MRLMPSVFPHEKSSTKVCLFYKPKQKKKELKAELSNTFLSFLMHIYGAKFQEHCFNTSRDIVYSVFSTF